MDATRAAATSPTIDPRLRDLREVCARTEAYAELCEAVVAAVAREDVEALLELAILARHGRATLDRARARGAKRDGIETPEGLELLARSTEAAARSLEGSEILARWAERALPSAPELLASAQGTVAFAEKMLPNVWSLDEDVVLFFGSGFENVAEVLRRVGQKRMVVYAGPELEVDYPEAVTVTRTAKDVYTAIRGMVPHAPRRLISQALQTANFDVDELEEVGEQAESAMRDARVYRNTTGAFAQIWTRQCLENLPVIASSASVAVGLGQFSGVPMVIVAPGPSLKKNVALLNAFKGKAILCTFSHTLTALKAAGVIPDVVLTVDANSLHYHFQDFPLEQVPVMVSGVAVHPDLFRMPAQRHLAAGANAATDRWVSELFGEDMALAGGGSVATSAATLGLRWGCDPIIFCGLDLSFPGGQYYVETSCDGGLKVETDGKTLRMDGWSTHCQEMRTRGGPVSADVQPSHELPGYYGGTVPTTFMFKLFHGWFEAMAKHFNDKVRILNCTEGGSYIDGMEHVPLAEALERHVAGAADLDVGARLDALIATLDVPARRNTAIRNAEAMRVAIDKSLGHARACVALVQRSHAQPKLERQLRRAERRLRTQLRKIRFMSILEQSEIERALDHASNAKSTDELREASQELYGAIIRAGEEIIPYLQRSIDVMRADAAAQETATSRRENHS